MKHLASISIFILSLLAGTALAAGQSSPPATAKPTTDHNQMDHSKMDQNAGHGHKVSPPGEFTALDTNKDGGLSQAELGKHKLGPHFGMLDTNKDGRLNPAEFAAGKGM